MGSRGFEDAGGGIAVRDLVPPALSGPQTADQSTTKAATDNANKKSADLKEVKPPSIYEELNDEINF